MKQPVSLLLCLLTVLGLCGFTSRPSPAGVPAWKQAYFDLLYRTLHFEMEARGVLSRYQIELFDMDGDGVPELQETYMSGNQGPYCLIWYVEDGQAHRFIGEMGPNENLRTDDRFKGLWRHNESGDLLLTDCIRNMNRRDVYFYYPTENKGNWRLQYMVSWDSTGYLPAGQPEELGIYNDYSSHITDYNGRERPLKNAAAYLLINDIPASCTRLAGAVLALPKSAGWSEDIARMISDFFDEYDGHNSCVADAPPSPPAEIPEWKRLYFDLLRRQPDGSGTLSPDTKDYRISLFDMDGDGVPELQESRTTNLGRVHCRIWFVENGAAVYFRTDQDTPENAGWFDGLYRHAETGGLVLYRSDMSAAHISETFFEPGETKADWRFFCKIELVAGDGRNDYFLTDADGTACPLSEAEYRRLTNHCRESEYIRVTGSVPGLYDNSSTAEQKLRRISNHFDAYDGVFSNVAGE